MKPASWSSLNSLGSLTILVLVCSFLLRAAQVQGRGGQEAHEEEGQPVEGDECPDHTDVAGQGQHDGDHGAAQERGATGGGGVHRHGGALVVGGQRGHDRPHRDEAGQQDPEGHPGQDGEPVPPSGTRLHEVGNVPPGQQPQCGAGNPEPADGALPTPGIADRAEDGVEGDVGGVDDHGHHQPLALAPAEVGDHHAGQDDEHPVLRRGVDQADHEAHCDARFLHHHPQAAEKHRRGRLALRGQSHPAARLLDTEEADQESGENKGHGDPHRGGLAQVTAAESGNGDQRHERAQGGQPAGEHHVEPPDRGAVAAVGDHGVDPHQEGESEERITETAEEVGGHDGQRRSGGDGEDEQHLEDDPDQEAQQHHPAGTPQICQCPGEIGTDRDGHAVHGDDGGHQVRLGAEGLGQVRGDEVGLHAVAGHEDQDGKEAPLDGIGDPQSVETGLGKVLHARGELVHGVLQVRAPTPGSIGAGSRSQKAELGQLGRMETLTESPEESPTVSRASWKRSSGNWWVQISSIGRIPDSSILMAAGQQCGPR